MMKKYFRLKLKTQLNILMFTASFFLLLVQVIGIWETTGILKENTMFYVEKLMHQVSYHISDFILEMENATYAVASNVYIQQYLMSNDYSRKFEYSRFIESFIRYIVNEDDCIQDIAVIDENGQIIFCNNSPVYEISQELAASHGEFISGSAEDSFFDMVTVKSGATYFVYVKPVNASFSTHRLGTCITIYNNRSIQSILENVDLTNGTALYLYNSDGTIIASSDYSFLNTQIPEELSNYSSGDFYEYQGQSCLVEAYSVLDRDWKLLCIIPRNEILGVMSSYTCLGAAVMVITVLVVIFLGGMLWRNITYPVGELMRQMNGEKRFLNRHIRIKVDTEAKNEIYEIGSSFNRLLEEVEQLNDKILRTQRSLYEAKVLQQEAEIYAMQNQINPHFLYNTLDCIRDISIYYHAKEIGEISVSMANIFRYSVVRQEYVPVKEELECVKYYLNITRIRYRDRFEIIQEIDNGIPEEKMPKFILQPIIENAVRHGLEKKAGKGVLKLSGQYREGNEIHFSIYDTGAGMSEGQLGELRKKLQEGAEPDFVKRSGIGLYNIQARIRSLYGERYGLRIDSKEREWTCVEVIIPGSAERQEK